MSDFLARLQERKDRASKLLFRAERYITTYGLPASFLSKRATGNINFISDVQAGSIPRHHSMDALEAFMDANPNGVDYQPRVPGGKETIDYHDMMETRRMKASPHAVVVNRDPCWKCGVRGDFGCEHRAAVEAVPLREAIG